MAFHFRNTVSANSGFSLAIGRLPENQSSRLRLNKYLFNDYNSWENEVLVESKDTQIYFDGEIIKIGLSDNKKVILLSESNERTSHEKRLKVLDKEAKFVFSWMKQTVSMTNKLINASIDVHLTSPSENDFKYCEERAYLVTPPKGPEYLKSSFLSSNSQRRLNNNKNREISEKYAEELKAWEKRRTLHEKNQLKNIRLFNAAKQGHLAPMEFVLAEIFKSIGWPIRMIFNFEFRLTGKKLVVHTTSPKESSIPDVKLASDFDNLRLKFGKVGRNKIRRLLIRNVNSTALKLTSIALSLLPTVDIVVVSIYDAYHSDSKCLTSVYVTRSSWTKEKFQSCPNQYASCFSIRQKVSDEGILCPVSCFR